MWCLSWLSSGCAGVFVVMIIVSWNVRGLGRLEKRLAVRKMVRRHKADLLLLQETKIARDVENVTF